MKTIVPGCWDTLSSRESPYVGCVVFCALCFQNVEQKRELNKLRFVSCGRQQPRRCPHYVRENVVVPPDEVHFSYCVLLRALVLPRRGPIAILASRPRPAIGSLWEQWWKMRAQSACACFALSVFRPQVLPVGILPHLMFAHFLRPLFAFCSCFCFLKTVTGKNTSLVVFPQIPKLSLTMIFYSGYTSRFSKFV